MNGVSKLLQQLLGEELGDGGDIGSGALVALERRLVWAIEDEDGMYSEGDEAEEAVVECSQGRICATCSRQYCIKACACLSRTCLCWLVSGRAISMCL